ncbi:MAG: hypothetical protein K9N23_11230 [Akkermansiaceae bacterium]|nr:hypothetical protein [Akkermansiaceae bacterium]
MSTELIDGNSWEANVKRWLRIRYPNDFQDVPATDGGDGGIEGFCISDQNVYQCYAALQSLDTRSLYENQRDKLTKDIGKFIDNQAKLIRTLPPGFKTRRYCFLVPEFRSLELVAHAQAKTQEVRAAALPYVAGDFSIIIQTKADYEAEQRLETARLLKNLQLEITDIDDDKVEAWVVGNNIGVQNLDRKIPLFTSLSEQTDVELERKYWIERKICTDNALEKLRSHSAEAWEKIWSVKVGRERLLGRSHGQFGSGSGTVAAISEKVVFDMIEQVPNLAKIGAETLAEGLVGEWLQNCKLNFRSAI